MPSTCSLHPPAQALKGKGAQDPFVSMVGLAFVMVAIAGEMAWHVNQARGQCWCAH